MEKTNEATPRPWTYEERCSGIVIIPKDLDDETIISSIIPDDEDDECTDQQEANAELIVKAVNMHDTLIEENQKLKADNEALRLAAHFISDDDVEAKLRNQVYQLQAEKAELIEKALEAFTPMFKVIPKQQNLILIVEALRDAYNKIESLKDKSLSREDYTKEHFTGE